MTTPERHREERFRALYTAHFDALLAYAVRRTRHPDDAADLVADTFLVAWRRLDELTPGEESRLWLYVVARHVRANAERGARRRARLGERLREDLSVRVVPDHATEVTAQTVVREALQRLGDTDRELLMLSAWEGLEPREIAEVLGIRTSAARTRLLRARRRLRDVLGDGSPGDEVVAPGHERGIRMKLSPEEGR
ncbi:MULTISPECIES: RNA polymerase sigma factor [Mumia]|uniref:RNA polymerase sigma factor n=1 Tax=Mumia xiangluensis TaxID=1678900 RepID=A0ABW1QSM8_9ACTN|nr:MULTISPECIES: sigma-70 family RNA polymerase sigma factor [Mumia]